MVCKNCKQKEKKGGIYTTPPQNRHIEWPVGGRTLMQVVQETTGIKSNLK